jgi:hypothetical protein
MELVFLPFLGVLKGEFKVPVWYQLTMKEEVAATAVRRANLLYLFIFFFDFIYLLGTRAREDRERMV